jgi:hypothetical protein
MFGSAQSFQVKVWFSGFFVFGFMVLEGNFFCTAHDPNSELFGNLRSGIELRSDPNLRYFNSPDFSSNLHLIFIYRSARESSFGINSSTQPRLALGLRSIDSPGDSLPTDPSEKHANFPQRGPKS